jgi:heme-degrading monooxygenase HmoA
MSRNPQEDANRRAKRDMQKAVDKVIDQKKKEPIGTKEAEQDVAADLNEAAREDIAKERRSRAAREPKSSSRADHRHVTQITVVESEPDKQAEALAVMTERARFMARQPGFVSISVHRSLDGRRIVNYIQWQSRELLQAAHKTPEFRREWGRFDKLTDDIDPHLYEVVHAADDNDAGILELSAR